MTLGDGDFVRRGRHQADLTGAVRGLERGSISTRPASPGFCRRQHADPRRPRLSRSVFDRGTTCPRVRDDAAVRDLRGSVESPDLVLARLVLVTAAALNSVRPRFARRFKVRRPGLCRFQLHVTDRNLFRPVRTSLALLAAIHAEAGSKFRWRTERYEYIDDKPAIDLLFGSDRERLALEAETAPSVIAATWVAEEVAFAERRRPFLLY